MNSQYENLIEQYSVKPDEYYHGARPEMLPFIPVESTRILEIGCGSGGFGKLIKEQRPGTVVWGIEPDKKSAEEATENLDRLITGTFSAEMFELQGQSFDVICLNDVLEHLINPESTLIDLKQFLSPDGVVVASIPNILFFYQISRILIEQDWKYEDAGILDNTHLRFFTKKSIIRMFEACGYDLISIVGINAGPGWKYKVVNALMLGRLKDWKYVHFAVQARSTG